MPVGGGNYTASSIESYEVRVNEVPPSNGTLRVDYSKTTLGTNLTSEIHTCSLNLTSYSPRLYCITLEVKDVADNVRQTRRFMLYDNSSFIETWTEKQFRFDSASPQTNFTWQTNHNNVCISWKDYFINKFYFDNQVLNPIEPEPNGLINGIYEQSTGLLPVSGTPNVHGITKYFVSWRLNNGHDYPEKLVQDFQNQSLCTHLNISDGQTYTFNIRPVDIVNNTYNESRTVYIDRSHPHINNIWLKKDGYETLYVHNSTDLSKMQMTFDALDPHSGLHTINWVFGIADTSTVLLQEHLAVNKINVCVKCYLKVLMACFFP
ncbi:hypothetical protein DPMN_068321 [Dreissena polymorpha]|uniref:Uncharacterized protein n=1 Tax=Dreissena polymorpha TaxID=45954 RepID=A0A9D3YZ06_DREPO|nr:hypothetical protein DPMN_068321 [Dreissena polymorpha]